MLDSVSSEQDPSALQVQNDWRRKVPSVSQLTRRIRGHLENSFFDVFVRGEVSNFRRPASGHGYFVLKDETTQLRSVIFRPFLSRLKFDLKDGMEVILHGKVTVYEARGEYQIVCDSIEPLGMGALQLAFEQLKEKLQKEGLFKKSHKQTLPTLPSRIGVVTSATGAAIRDILQVLHRRYPNREVLLFPASVQGEKAAGEIVSAIENAQVWNMQNPDREIELLIVGRGGGSIEDLWPFNEEVVARAIFECRIPTISAVGHEIDFTIADFVADLRAPTPSAAAEQAVPLKEDLVERIDERQEQLYDALTRNIEQWRLHIDHLTRRLTDPREKLKQQRESIQALRTRLKVAILHDIELAKGKFHRATQLLNSLSPLEVLSRGYSISRIKNHIVRSVNEANPGDTLITRVNDGEIQSQVLPSKT